MSDPISVLMGKAQIVKDGIEYNPSTHAHTPEYVHAKNQAMIAARGLARHNRPGPRVGDYLRLADGEYLRFTHDWGDGLQTSCRKFGCGGFYLNSDGTASYSGALDPAISKERLRMTGETQEGRFWFFSNNEARAHNAVYFTIPCRVFELIGHLTL